MGLYLNNIGTLHTTIEDRRNTGWGLVSIILSYISSIASNQVRIQVGLQLRDSILVQTLLNSLEVCSNLTSENINRIEQVDDALLRGILGSHPKGPKVFPYLELGVLKLGHILIYRRKINFLRYSNFVVILTYYL